MPAVVLVKIDGIETILTYNVESRPGAHRYNTTGNVSQHSFPWPLYEKIGQKFRINGHDYEVISQPQRREESDD